MTTSNSSPPVPPTLPALLGGEPVRPGGTPRFDAADAEVREVLMQLATSGDWQPYHGPHIGRLIAAISHSMQVSHVHLCCSGTAAVEIGLRSLGVGSGDEVLMSVYDFKANFMNVVAIGATPVLVDIRRDDAQLNVALLEQGRTERTRAVIASHLHGGLVDMVSLRDWADMHQIPILEDACQSPGAMVQGRSAGTWGDIGTLSFGGSKLVTAGRGGGLVTSRADIAQRITLLTQRGNDSYPLSEMQAAILLPQWERLGARNAQRLEGVSSLRASLVDAASGTSSMAPGLTLFSHRDPQGDQPAYYKVGLFYDPSHFEGLPRERLSAAMRAEGFALDPGFDLLHQIHSRRRYRLAGPVPVAESANHRILTLHHPILLHPTPEVTLFATAARKLKQAAHLLH